MTDPTPLFDRLQQSAGIVRDRIGDRRPRVGLILGSGLGAFADELADAVRIPYAEIPGFPVSTVHGHAGRLVVGHIEGVDCVAMQGRAHYYEDHDLQTITFPARTLIQLGARTLIITNAAGGVASHLAPGTLMVIRDHINLFGDNPLIGLNDDRLGPRFPDMTTAYDGELRALVMRVAGEQGVALAEGVYAGCHGPSYETPAEVQMIGRLGGDAVGMSTVPETIVANHMGARVLGISCITNLAAGIGDAPLSHDEVTETAGRIRDTFIGLLRGILRELGVQTGGEA